MDKFCLLVDPVEHDKAGDDSRYLFHQRKSLPRFTKAFSALAAKKQFVAGESK